MIGEILNPVVKELAIQATESEDATLARHLFEEVLARRIDPLNPPPPDTPVFHVAGKLVSTAGNLSAIVAPAKAGKSAFIGAHMAACLVGAGLGRQNADTLGVTSCSPGGKAVLLIDTEQSPSHAAKNLIQQVLTRVGLLPSDCPKWMSLFALAGLPAFNLTETLAPLLNYEAERCGGIHAVFVDGGADFAVNVNDPEEAAKLCAEWHALAIKFKCSIVVVVHSNEGAKSDDVARGWLGKQLRRKAESNLTLKRSGDAIVVFSESGQRHAPIFEKDGPRFAWSDEAGMHVSVESVGNSKHAAKVSELIEIAAEAYGTDKRLRWADLVAKIITVRGCAKRTAERTVKDMQAHGVIGTDGMGFKERKL